MRTSCKHKLSLRYWNTARHNYKFNTVLLHSNCSNLRRKYWSQTPTDLNVLSCGLLWAITKTYFDSSLSLRLFALASLQKFLRSSLCIVQRVHFQVRIGVFNRPQILTKISFDSLSFVLRCCNNFLQRRKAANLISCVSFFNRVKFYTPKIK